VTNLEDLDDAERAAQLLDDAEPQPEGSLPLEAEPADVIEQILEVPQDDDNRDG
jgi:hypothetical protein